MISETMLRQKPRAQEMADMAGPEMRVRDALDTQCARSETAREMLSKCLELTECLTHNCPQASQGFARPSHIGSDVDMIVRVQESTERVEMMIDSLAELLNRLGRL